MDAGGASSTLNLQFRRWAGHQVMGPPDVPLERLRFGPTPISEGNETRLASPTSIWAGTLDDVRTLVAVRDGQTVVVEHAA